MSRQTQKRVLVLGVSGMLGHKLYQQFKNRFHVWGSLRSSFKEYARYEIFDPSRIISGLDAADLDRITETVSAVKPDVVINCIGIIKQLPTAKDPIISIKINSLLPHQLANICQPANARFIHISTDCVFAGTKGRYTELDTSDATDLYGRTKFLGEVAQPGCLTLRTSIIGRELSTTTGLVEWFLSNRNGKVKGYKKAIYTGFTTLALSDIIARLIEKHPDLSGVYQVSSEPVDKFSLLCMIRDAFGLNVQIEPDLDVCVDRSLDNARFRNKTGFQPPSWEQMIKELAADPTPYDAWRAVKT